MVFVVVQICVRCRVLKLWYRCVVADQGTLVDLYHKYASGHLDNSEAISSDYATSMHTWTQQARLSADVPVEEAIFLLGQYVNFNVEVQEASQDPSTLEGCMWESKKMPSSHHQ